MLPSEEYHAIFLAAPDGMFVVDDDGIIRDVNPKAVELFGWTREELVEQPVEVLVPEALRGRHCEHRGGFMAHPRNRPMGMGLDLLGRRKDGTTFPVEISLSPWKMADARVRVICAVRDVTAHRRLRDFSEGALRATEDERRRIARELHDDTAQRLATLILRVRALAEERDEDARLSLLEEVRAEIVAAAEDVKRISRGLRPPELEEVGLALALRAHLRVLRERLAFEVDADLVEVGTRLDLTGKLALYRIIQEALSNARRHADAERVHLSLFVEEGAVVVEVTDDGRGFDPASPMERDRGLGLIGMKERTTMVGGRLHIESAPGHGTSVRVAVPFTTSEADHG
ncbi:MAG: PAS domain S-box protein [Gemmatimonadota bacterium]|nr:PAS domain S-box protein [Gemmatimonadota bacterium]